MLLKHEDNRAKVEAKAGALAARPMSTFSAELLRFIGELRLAEVPVSVAETLDAMRAVAMAGFVDRSRMREALAAALIKDEADREAFDKVFERFFGRGTGVARETGSPHAHNRLAGSSDSGRGEEGASDRSRTERARSELHLTAARPPGCNRRRAPSR